MKKISIIIPIYNVEEYLSECLDSVVNQTYKNLEIICVNDCSTDNSLKILKNYARQDLRIRIIEHEKNKGLGPARNTGIDNANGDYIFFLDSDDYVKNDVIEKLYDKITETKSDLVFSQTEAFTFLKDEETINRIKYLNEWLDCRSKKDFYINVDNFEDAICNINCVAWGKLYKKEFLIKNNIRFINGKVIHEDNGFWLKICSQFPKIGFINDIGVYYRIRENAITTEIDKKKNIHKKHKHMKLVLKDVFDYFKKYSNPILYDFFNIQIKNSSEYNRYFYTELGILFKFRWLVNDKKIIIFGLPLFREKIKGNNCKIRKILGVKVYKTNRKPISSTLKKKLPIKIIDKENTVDFKTDNKNTEIKRHIDNLNEFYFLPNQGNLGDIVIAATEFQYLENYNYKYEIWGNKKNKKEFNLLYGGGGIWHKLYQKDYQEVIKIFKSRYLKKCVILPSSFYDCEDAILAMDERFIVFCREKQSLEYCLSLNDKAKFILADDMVTNANFDIFKKEFYNSENIRQFKDKKVLSSLYLNYFKTLINAKNNLKECKDFNVGYFLRSDLESVITLLKSNTIDVSSCGGGCARNIGLTFLLAKIFIATINEFNIVVTDRLHVGICAAKLGKQVLLLDNSYKKVSGVYNLSLAKYSNVKMTTLKDMEKDLSNCLKTNYENDKCSMFETLPQSIEDFFISNASFKNKYKDGLKLW